MQRPHIHFSLGTVLPHHLTRAMKGLFGSVAILGFAISAVTIFEPIYLLTIGYDVRAIAIFYCLSYAAYVLVLPFGAKFIARFGYERSILIGSLFFIPYYLSLFGMDSLPWLYWVAPLLFTAQKVFYWPAFYAYFTEYSTQGEVGRELGEASLLSTSVSILGPVAGGAVITAFGFPFLFGGVAVLIFLSNLPLLVRRQVHMPQSLPASRVWKHFFSRGRRRYALAYAGYAEEAVYSFLWPIFLFTFVAGALRLGIIMTAAGILTSLVLLYVGKQADVRNRPSMVHTAAITTSIISFLRSAVISPLTFFFGETFYRICRGALDLPLLTDLYERAKREGILQTVTSFEISLAFGKALLLGVVAILATPDRTPWLLIFLLGTMMAWLFLFLPRSQKQKA